MFQKLNEWEIDKLWKEVLSISHDLKKSKATFDILSLYRLSDDLNEIVQTFRGHFAQICIEKGDSSNENLVSRS